MNLALVKKLIKILEKSSVDEIEVEQDGLRVRLARNGPAPAGAYPGAAPGMLHGAVGAQHAPPIQHLQAAHTTHGAAAPAAAAPPAAIEKTYHEIRSPIVGTFYRASAPDADPYIEVGAMVQEKSVLCIVEAMKLMNEIESDVSGRVVKILVENGRPVEYNQVLFHIEPA
jgi:acetyl-CoA carboxylase biotin carboxyl carrier protein